MKKFFILLKKEIFELLTPQMLLPFIFMMLAFIFIGKVVGKEMEEKIIETKISVLDLDTTNTSKFIVSSLKGYGFTINEYKNETKDVALSIYKENNEKLLIIIPKGFEEGLLTSNQLKIDFYSNIQSLSLTANQDIQTCINSLNVINELLSKKLINEEISDINADILKNPIILNEYVIVANKQANINSSLVLNFIMSQTTFIPIVLFLVISLASQLVASAIATEKENKTLETLLSTPINRKAIVASKLLGAGIVSLLMASMYLIGMKYYTSGFTGQNVQSAIDSGIEPLLKELGLTFEFRDYLFLGISLFSGILAALSLAFILGSFAQDTKSAQGVIAPIMVMLLIPYLLSMFVDINSLSPILRIAIYAIPFTHTFISAPNILLGNYSPVILGNLYLWIIFLICVYTASKLFTTEKILTVNLKFGKKSKIVNK